ncbi:MAG: hypothetical protein JW940_21310 [Polyangiaceae bacterium]|nr:hypothetical protein [Polyangiaceae bacterium]
MSDMRWQLPFGVFIAAATVVSYWERAAVESIGRSVGAELAACGRIIGWRGKPAAAVQARPVVLPAMGPQADPAGPEPPKADARSAGGGRASAGRRAKAATGGAPPSSLMVRAATVLRIADSGARPSGVPVPASDVCPAGIALSGVGTLGLGLRDGDRLVRAGGMPALDPGAVISAVVASRGARVPVISGQICRDGTLFTLVVEQPYLASPGLQANGVHDERCLDPTNVPCDAGSGTGSGG